MRILNAPRYEWQDLISSTVKKQQKKYRWDPKNPKTSAAKSLFFAVQDKLTFRHSELELHCSLGSQLDWHHETDGFFLIKPYVVALDLKSRQSSIYLPRDKRIVCVSPWRGHPRIATVIAHYFNEQFAVDYRIREVNREEFLEVT